MSKNYKKKHTPQHLQKKEYRGAPIDVVVTTAGRFDMLEVCLNALYREAQLVPINLYIVDIDTNAEERSKNNHLFVYNSEKDPSKNVLTFGSKRTTTNVGFPLGANTGAKIGNAPLIMFISDDVELHVGTLEKVVKDFDDQSVGVVGIKTLFPLNSGDKNRPAGKVQHVGLALNIQANPIHPLIGWSVDNPRACVTRDAWAVTGACFTIRRSLFQKAGGFDLIYGKGTYEDADLCLKVRSFGFRIIVDVSATAYHYVGASVEKRQEGFNLQQNNTIFKSRWANPPYFLWDEHLYW
jgi:GT2 family glycosyltransferase